MVVLKTPGELDLMDEANRIVHRVLDGIAERIGPGVTTGELDRWAEATIREAGGVPAFLNYKGFPATLCTALNDVIVHGIPDDRALISGDIVGLDCGVLYKGYYGDAARTYPIGEVSVEVTKLLRVTQEALDLAVECMHSKGRLRDIGYAVEGHVKKHGFSVVKEFVGHGVGTSLHEDPQVPNFADKTKRMRLKPGLVLAIEPMINAGAADVEMDSDGWTARTQDGTLSAHFEYSVAITPQGPRILGRERGYLADARLAQEKLGAQETGAQETGAQNKIRETAVV